MHILRERGNLVELIIKHFEEVSKENRPGNTGHVVNMFLSGLKYLRYNKVEINEFWFSLIEESESSDQTIFEIHKSFRNIDLSISSEVDMVIWHALQINSIMKDFSEIIVFIEKIIKEDLYNKNVDNYIEKVYDKFIFQQEF